MSLLDRLPRPLTTPRAAVWAALALVATFALARLPLFGVLGYELALTMAAFGSIAGLDLGAAWVRRRRRGADRPGPGRLLGEAVLAPVVIVLVPLVLLAIRGLWVRTCDWWFGLEAYVALALASTALAAASGAALTIWVGRRRFLTPAVPWLALVVLLVIGVRRLLGAPAVFSYSPLVGYFPGNLYDEDIRLTAALGWARLEQLAVVAALALGAAARFDREALAVRWRGGGVRRALAAGAIAAALVAGGLRWRAGQLGYAIDADDVAAELGGVRRTAHFVIHFDKRPAIEAEMDLIAADHELRLAQVCATIGVDVASVGTIRSFYFANADRKARLMGARQVEMAKPWRREIYLTHESFPHGSLRHEIAHVVAGQFGDPWFHVAARRVLGLPLLVNPGLIEGLAVAIDWPGGRGMTPHQAMRAMELLGFAPSAGEVFSVKFLTLSSARSYTAAGSFLRFLLDTYGAAPVRAVYASGGDFAAAFGKSRDALVAEWRAMLATVVVPAADLEAARERFRRGGVFSRPCPHAIAARMERATDRAVAGDRRGAIRAMRAVCRDAPEEPAYELGLADLLVRGDADETREGRAIYQRWLEAGAGAAITAEVHDSLAHLDAAAGDRAGARAHVEAALALPLDDERRRPFEALAAALDGGDLAGPFLRGYFFAPGDRLAWALMAWVMAPGQPLPRYLLALQWNERGQPALGVPLLDGALASGLPTPRFVRAGARRLVVAAWRIGHRAALDRAIAILDATGVEVDRLLAADWRERAATAR